MQASTIGGINKLPEREKRAIYARYVPPELIDRFALPDLVSNPDLLKFRFQPGSSDVEMSLYHEVGFPDPILYAHMADTLNGQIHVLLYVLNDPDSLRFDVDKLPDGSPTDFGIKQRNIPAEMAALQAGLAPGQIRKGLHVFREAASTFEQFLKSIGHDMYYVEPLYYHNAVTFERHGFSYQMGKRKMESIHTGFENGGALNSKLDESTLFRSRAAVHSVRLRSWAIHDGILGESFTGVTMYKRVGISANISTTPGCDW